MGRFHGRLLVGLLCLSMLGCDAGLKNGPGPGLIDQPLQLLVTPASIDFTASAGSADPAAQTVSIQNAGPGTVTGLGVGSILYEPVVGGWLSASIGGATFAPATLTLNVDISGMGPGLYFAIVPVVSSVTGVLERDVVVSLTITSVPTIVASPDTVIVVASVGGANPSPQPVAIVNGGSGSVTGMSVGAIVYDSATGWLGATIDQPTDPATVTLTADITGLPAGVYSALVPIVSSTAGVIEDTVVTILQVTNAASPPAIGLAPTVINMAANAGGANPPLEAVRITNAGGGTLTNLTLGTVTYQPVSTTWLSGTLNQNTAPATLTLSANIGSLAPGSYNARIPVISAGASNTPRNVIVHLTVNGSLGLKLSPQVISFTGTTGQPNPSPQTVTITNTGAGALAGIATGNITYSAGQPTGWLAVSLVGSTTPTALVLTANTGSLAGGTYNALVPVTSTTPGVAPGTADVEFFVASASGYFNIIGGDGQTGLVDSVLPLTLVARVADANLQPKAGVSVVWQVNNVGTLINPTTVTDALGQVTAKWKLGHIAGIQTVRVSSAGLPTLTFSADAQLPPSGGSQHPHEPTGYVRFAEHNMSSLPSFPRSLGGLLGSWYGFPQNDPDLVVVTPDTSAPASPPNVIQTRFPANMNAGVAPVDMGGWDAAGSTNGQKSKLYVSLNIKIEGTDYENQSTGTKLGFIGVGEAIAASGNEGFWLLAGNPSKLTASNFALRFHQQDVVNRTITQNVTTANVMTVGAWHHWEVVMELNTLGQADGIFKMWVDNILIMDYSDVEWIVPGKTNRFNSWKWNPTWGGVGGRRTRDDFIKLDHVYLSGVP